MPDFNRTVSRPIIIIMFPLGEIGATSVSERKYLENIRKHRSLTLAAPIKHPP